MWPLHVMARRRPGRRRGGALRLDPEEKLMELGSRSFFLCFKAAPADASPARSPVVETAKATASPAKRPNMQVPWLGLMHFWPLL
ncbi:hypothetical protein PR202_gb08652 [Eleusine coracana subsp. coracana]|nr:hypothetical protein PR202_gb08652 [Eleusine coracana subsp. coracana]